MIAVGDVALEVDNGDKEEREDDDLINDLTTWIIFSSAKALSSKLSICNPLNKAIRCLQACNWFALESRTIFIINMIIYQKYTTYLTLILHHVASSFKHIWKKRREKKKEKEVGNQLKIYVFVCDFILTRAHAFFKERK